MSSESISDPAYLEALEETKVLGDPAIGYQGAIGVRDAPKWAQTLVKQQNTQISLLIHLSKELEYLKREIRLIKAEKGTQGEVKSVISEDLVAKLENLTLAKGERPKQPKGVKYVYKDPYVILAEEQAKLKAKQQL